MYMALIQKKQKKKVILLNKKKGGGLIASRFSVQNNSFGLENEITLKV